MTYMFPPRLFGESAPSFPSVMGRNSGASGSFGASYNAPLPSGIVSGEYLLVAIHATQSTGIGPTINTPSGWTELAHLNAGSFLHTLKVIGKSASGSEGATVTITSPSSVQMSAISSRISNWGGTVAVSSGTSGNASVPNPASVTPSWGLSYGTLFIPIMSSSWDANTIIGAPTDYTNLNAQSGSSNIGGTPVQTRVASAERLLQTASEDPGAFSPSTWRWRAVTIALRGA